MDRALFDYRAAGGWSSSLAGARATSSITHKVAASCGLCKISLSTTETSAPCQTGKPLRTNYFFAEGELGEVSFVGRGECITAKQNFPEPGLNVIRCFLELSNLPAAYVGGQLTTNTINSRAVVGGVSDPPGYAQPSIATIRLWRKR